MRRSVEDEKIDVLIEAALCAPSSRGLNPWEFVAVTERDLLEKRNYSVPPSSDFGLRD